MGAQVGQAAARTECVPGRPGLRGRSPTQSRDPDPLRFGFPSRREAGEGAPSPMGGGAESTAPPLGPEGLTRVHPPTLLRSCRKHVQHPGRAGL